MVLVTLVTRWIKFSQGCVINFLMDNGGEVLCALAQTIMPQVVLMINGFPLVCTPKFRNNRSFVGSRHKSKFGGL